MTHTATKQRIPGDVDDRIDELEKLIETLFERLARQGRCLDTFANVIEARIEKLEQK